MEDLLQYKIMYSEKLVELDHVNKEFHEFQEMSKILESELESELETVMVAKIELERENSSLKEKLPYCSYEIGNDLPIRLNSFSNLYSIGLIILQMSLLIDTSRLYPRESEKKLKEELLKIEDENLRRTLIGVLLPANSRINYEKAIKILNGNI